MEYDGFKKKIEDVAKSMYRLNATNNIIYSLLITFNYLDRKSYTFIMNNNLCHYDHFKRLNRKNMIIVHVKA